MGRSVNPLEPLGRRVAATQDRQLAGFSLADAKRRLLARKPRVEWRMRAALLAAALLALLAVLVFARREPPPLTFVVASDPGHLGEWMAPRDSAETPVKFSDGSTVTLAPASRARVASADGRGAVVVLERGALDAQIVHRATTSWRIDVGAFSVHVTGTRFHLSWDPDREMLHLHVDEGSTRVTGPSFPGGQAVETGASLSLSTKEPSAAAESPAPPPSAVTTVVQPSVAPLVAAPTATATATASAPATAVTDAAPAAAPTWRELAGGGKYKDALQRAESDGFDALVESLGVVDLVTLADTARLAGDLGRATQVYVSIRKRYPGSRDAALAAFTLGRMAFDQRGAFANAAHWFRTYLAEQPNGALAREAAGRLIEALERGGDPEGAREAAAHYLASWPSGPHAEKARSLIASP